MLHRPSWYEHCLKYTATKLGVDVLYLHRIFILSVYTKRLIKTKNDLSPLSQPVLRSHLRHSGSMHFSVCSSSSAHSAGSDFSILCRVRTARPHVALHSLQSDQGDSVHGMASAGTPRKGDSRGQQRKGLEGRSSITTVRRLTALRHHALLHLGHLRPAHGAVNRGHLDHALASPHPQAAGDAAGVPLSPLRHHAAAGCWAPDKESHWRRRFRRKEPQGETQCCHYSPLGCFSLLAFVWF